MMDWVEREEDAEMTYDQGSGFALVTTWTLMGSIIYPYNEGGLRIGVTISVYMRVRVKKPTTTTT